MTYADADSTERTQAGTATFQTGLLGIDRRIDGSNVTYWMRDNNGTLLAQARSNTWWYYLHDALGSVIGLIDSNGNLANTYRYDPYGNITATTGNVENPWQYAGGYKDTTGLTKFGTRYYDAATARWTQLDPSGADPGYIYVGGNPCNAIDPTGYLFFELVDVALTAKDIRDLWGSRYDRKKFKAEAAGAIAGAATGLACGATVAALAPATLGGSVVGGLACLSLSEGASYGMKKIVNQDSSW